MDTLTEFQNKKDIYCSLWYSKIGLYAVPFLGAVHKLRHHFLDDFWHSLPYISIPYFAYIAYNFKFSTLPLLHVPILK